MKCPRVRSRTEFHRKDGPASSYPGERRVRAEPRVAARGAKAEKPAPTTPRSSAAKVRRAKSRKSAASKNKKLTAEKRGFPKAVSRRRFPEGGFPKAVSRRRFVAVRPASPWSATGLWFRRLGGLRRPPGRCGRSGLGRSRRRGGHRGCRFGDPVAAPVRPTRHRRSKGRRRS